MSRIVYAWPDGTWVDSEEYSEAEYSWKSDDFSIISLPADSDENDVTRHVDQLFSQVVYKL